MMSPSRTVLGVALLVALASAPIGTTARRGLEEQKSEVADTVYFGRKLMQGGPTCSFGCAKLATCVTATCNYYNSTHNYVTINMITCKGGTISWFCCRESAPGACSLDSSTCAGTINGNTCNDDTAIGYYISNTSMTETWTEPSPALAPTTAAAAPASPASSQPPSPAAPEPPSPAAPEPPSAQPSPAPSSPPASQPPSAQPSPAPSSPAPAQPPASEPSPAPSSPATPQPAAPQPSPTPSSASAPEPPSSKPASAPSSPAASQPASSQPPSSPAAAPSSQPPASQPAAAPSSSPSSQPPASQPPAPPSSEPPACSTGEAQPGTTVPTFKFTTGSPAASSSPLFTWNPLQTVITDAGSDKWGGYFTITTPSSGQTFTTATTATTIAAGPFGCAGCAKNDPRRGWDVGGVIIQVRAVNATFVTASCSLLIRNNANVTAVVDQGHFYASYTPMPNFNPGQFPTATITGIPGAEGTNTTMTARVGGTKAANSSPIYLACHWGVAAC
ncbi:hypothetical protein HYH03_016489 [Edaphochlamys debaryana]|uniref:Uncharacterized protein n=1 Tax=Edaphochlamys debaryana TaxID=47281 RepID=A0A835XHI5_9CHLO|nr:hypothetical protein HYH03_016489 [Edaphochlamys debaryana]|eukprot:KAG2484742.1 hypothetical protein HYH03_016489 [Edaphochlamys debaryana]